jgi:hypothetical protein
MLTAVAVVFTWTQRQAGHIAYWQQQREVAQRKGEAASRLPDSLERRHHMDHPRRAWHASTASSRASQSRGSTTSSQSVTTPQKPGGAHRAEARPGGLGEGGWQTVCEAARRRCLAIIELRKGDGPPMPATQRRSRESARHTRLAGVEQLAKAVKVTLGPKGRHVVLDQKWGAPTITKDEATVAKAIETSLEVVEGMPFDRGYVSPYFVTAPETMEAVLEEPYLLIYEKQTAQAGKPLLIIAEEVEGETLATLVVNQRRGTLPCAAVKAPGYGDCREAILEDIAMLTGGDDL